MDASNIAGFVASVLGSIGLLIAGLRYIIKLENLPLISRLDKLESTLETLAFAMERDSWPDWFVDPADPIKKIGWEDGEEDI